MKRITAWLKWAWNPPASKLVTSHEFVPLSWDSGCGYLPGPQADRCFRPRRYHKS